MKGKLVVRAILAIVVIGVLLLAPFDSAPTAKAGPLNQLPNAGWEEVGAGSASSGGVSVTEGAMSSSLAISLDGTPYVAWWNIGRIYIKRFNGTAWVEVGTGSASGDGIGYASGGGNLSLAIAPNGEPYVAWESDVGNGETEIYIKRWDGAAWTEVGAGSASGGGISSTGLAENPSLAIAPDGEPYIAWEDRSGGGNSNIYIRRFNGISWVEVGAGSASGGGISSTSGVSCDPSLAIAPDGNPYVAWRDWNWDGIGNTEIYAKRWNGTSWVEVGTGSASEGGVSNSTGQADDPSVAVASDNAPYIAWRDSSSGNGEIYVRRFNGTSWVEVGTGSASGGGISNMGSAGDPSIKIAPDDNPYVAWEQQDWVTDYDIYIKRWDGAAWIEVGVGSASGGGISDDSGYSSNPSLAIAPNSVPYIAWFNFAGGPHGGDVYIRRYTGGLTYSVSGRVVDGKGGPVQGVTVSAGAGRTATTDGNGNYVLSGLPTNTHMLTPSKSGYTFAPATKRVIVPPSKTGQDFVATPVQPTCKVPFFSQIDGRWVSHPLRTCGTIGTWGCTLTSAAMVFSYYGANTNPPALSDCMGASACPFVWRSASTYCSGGKANLIGWGPTAFSWSRLDQELNQNYRLVILGMRRKSNSDLRHWVVAISGHGSNPADYRVHDPGYLDGANRRLNDAAYGYEIYSMAIYNGSSPCAAESSANAASLNQQQYAAVTTANSTAVSSIVTGEVLPYSGTAVTTTMLFAAQSSAANVTEMLVWTDSISNTVWQPIEILLTLPVSEHVYAQFRDEMGNTSEVCMGSIYPSVSVPDAPTVFTIFLPLVTKNHIRSGTRGR